MKNSAFFTDYAVWLNGVLTSRGMRTEHLTDSFQCVKAVFMCIEELTEEKQLFNEQVISQAIYTLEKASRPAVGDSL